MSRNSRPNGPRLGRDIAGREAQVHIGGQHVVAVLGDDLAVPGLVEAIDQGAVQSGDPADFPRRQCRQLVDRRGTAQRVEELVDVRIDLVERARLRTDRAFQLIVSDGWFAPLQPFVRIDR